MPPPYAVIQTPPGSWDDIFDRQAIEMAISHNMFIRGLNAIYFHAPNVREGQVQAFAFFCNSLLGLIHHHHHMEEEIIFPLYEEKLGAGAMEHNVQDHHAFKAGLEDLETYIQDIRAGRATYDGKLVTEKLDAFADGLVQHLNDELPTLESSKLRAKFSKKDLEGLAASLEKRIMKEVSLTESLPPGLVLHDRTTAPQFPPLPKPILWLTKYGLYHIHSDAWAFGPCDVHGTLKPGFSNHGPVAAA
ncbi:putative hemerythrin HHE cation binding domain [Lyophyllum shimeji]|uniref:Hemerythrin HHE cation binding domain n=1 Tax=Lyophyllum shimeji TaxID=47721 RepID=A0A9P3PQ73_LYOSH|nr:putative hemerythrin HHE cation binding domain [Lyophyllum shimeji]